MPPTLDSDICICQMSPLALSWLCFMPNMFDIDNCRASCCMLTHLLNLQSILLLAAAAAGAVGIAAAWFCCCCCCSAQVNLNSVWSGMGLMENNLLGAQQETRLRVEELEDKYVGLGFNDRMRPSQLHWQGVVVLTRTCMRERNCMAPAAPIAAHTQCSLAHACLAHLSKLGLAAAHWLPQVLSLLL